MRLFSQILHMPIFFQVIEWPGFAYRYRVANSQDFVVIFADVNM